MGVRLLVVGVDKVVSSAMAIFNAGFGGTVMDYCGNPGIVAV
jgi:hypothetical protein